jgi:peptidoglycan/LPS O-acetylase OafA/YrhL
MSPLHDMPGPARPQYRCLDAWRGIACLMVMAFHSSNFGYATATTPGSLTGFSDLGGLLLKMVSLMWVGVPIFFVISGYCIASASDSARERRGDIKDFLLRRFRRILPTYWAALALAITMVCAASLAGRPEMFHGGMHAVPRLSDLTLGNWVGNIALIETWRPHIFGGEYRLFAAQAWTLCYEEQFYLICGLLVAIVPRRFFVGIAAISVLVAVNVILARVLHVYPNISGVFFDGHWLLFAAGVTVYYRIHHASGRPARLLAPGFAAIALGLMIGRRSLFSEMGAEFVIEMIVGGLFSAALILLWGCDLRLSRSMLLRPIAWCGTRSYSIYLVHSPACSAVSREFWIAGFRGVWPTLLVTIPVTVGASVLLAWGFYELIERRFHNRPHSGILMSPTLPALAPSRSADAVALAGMA